MRTNMYSMSRARLRFMLDSEKPSMMDIAWDNVVPRLFCSYNPFCVSSKHVFCRTVFLFWGNLHRSFWLRKRLAPVFDQKVKLGNSCWWPRYGLTWNIGHVLNKYCQTPVGPVIEIVGQDINIDHLASKLSQSNRIQGVATHHRLMFTSQSHDPCAPILHTLAQSVRWEWVWGLGGLWMVVKMGNVFF